MINKKVLLCAIASVAMTAGYNSGSGNKAAGNNSAGNVTANQAATSNSATPAPAAAAGGSTVDGSFLAGHWTLAGQPGACEKFTMSFAQDGTLTMSDGTPPGRWRLEGGNMIVLEAPGQPVGRMPISRNGDTFAMTSQQGQQSFTRCPAAAAGAGAGAGSAAPGAEEPEAAEEEQ